MLAPTVEWQGETDGYLALLDQTLLPEKQLVLEHRELAGVIDSIKRLAVRGAPAIGVAAGYGMVVGVREAMATGQDFASAMDGTATLLHAARPTAVNLSWAVHRVHDRGRREPKLEALLAEARDIHKEDVALCLQIGEHGASLIRDGMRVLTHCNAGRLATSGDGTALAVFFAAHRQGRKFRVLADETRPLLQGSRLTALELAEEGIPVDVIADSAAAGLMARGEIDMVITGADRIAANGDVANKVGTYSVSLAAKAHGIPMYVAAPASTFDQAAASGKDIPIEDRDPDEVLNFGNQPVAAPGAGAKNPAFDLTPAENLAGLITDRGLISPVTREEIKALVFQDR